ncbi:hypothetical protein [Sphingobacterium sp. LRF_L2]|uniref:hypothetical protein n=1 Tax=Sphingobacterium sp. LRF_L2 TaxID=3369421 RepID=UPI003F5E1C06
MKTTSYNQWLIRGLIIITAYQLCWSGGRLISQLIDQTLPAIYPINDRLSSLGNLLLGLLLTMLIFIVFFLGYILIIFATRRTSMFFEQLHAILYRQNEQGVYHPYLSPRNLLLLLSSSIGTYYMLFIHDRTSGILYWTACLLVIALLIQKERKSSSTFVMISLLAVYLFFCTVKLNMLIEYRLLYDSATIILSHILAIVFTGILIIRFWRKIPNGIQKLSWRINLVILLSIPTIFYFRTALTVINCEFWTNRPGENYKAVVQEKCPVYQNTYDLYISYHDGKKTKSTLLTVHPKLYAKVKRGDTISMHLHGGSLGWPWYHDHISKRYYE